MIATEILNNALNLLGYSENNANSNLTQNIRSQAIPIINLIYAELSRNCDLKNTLIKSLNDEIKLPERVLSEIMPCGVAMYIANTLGDSGAQAFWGAEYNSKRATLSQLTQIVDTVPNIGG